jgi:hypothetical protein
MEPKQKRILRIAIILIIIGIIFLVAYLFLPKNFLNKTFINKNTNGRLHQPQPINVNQKIVTVNGGIAPVNPDENQVKNVSLNFSERFGSYSNQGNLANFDDLQTMVTEAIQTFINNTKKAIEAEDDNYYHGLTTKAIKVAVNILEGDQAETVVTTQRQETDVRKNITNRVFYQDLKLKLVKDNGRWLVAGAWWQ